MRGVGTLRVVKPHKFLCFIFVFILYFIHCILTLLVKTLLMTERHAIGPSALARTGLQNRSILFIGNIVWVDCLIDSAISQLNRFQLTKSSLPTLRSSLYLNQIYPKPNIQISYRLSSHLDFSIKSSCLGDFSWSLGISHMPSIKQPWLPLPKRFSLWNFHLTSLRVTLSYKGLLSLRSNLAHQDFHLPSPRSTLTREGFHYLPCIQSTLSC